MNKLKLLMIAVLVAGTVEVTVGFRNALCALTMEAVCRMTCYAIGANNYSWYRGECWCWTEDEGWERVE